MNKDLEEKIKFVYKDCKQLASKYEPPILMGNNGHTKQEVYDEFCKQINYTNVYLNKKKDLEFVKALLDEVCIGLDYSTPSGNKTKTLLDSYRTMIDDLLRVYNTINISLKWVLSYYDKGGGFVDEMDV